MQRTGALIPFLFLVAVAACTGPLRLTPSDADQVLARHTLDEENPATPGPYGWETLYYGSGTDKHRPEYRDSVTIVTETVDASKLVDLGESADSRNGYWGFSPDSFPVNGRVWYPDGDGPFPLVLVVHGNHDMRDFSDPGYDWLGELLASRGYILASVDMNFINGGIRDENDGRGWMLLKHLQAWRGFNEEGPFQGRVDLDNIGIMGHSRGGEAVGHAAAFNMLSHYPDDASLEFEFGFNIKAVVAIAPVDGQYLPADQRVPVQNVNYLVFHGSHDGDVTSFHGLRQYNRVSFTDGGDWFKSAIYVYRANHGQWNTVWGSHDSGPRSGRSLDLRGLIPQEDQRRFAELYVSAFLDVVLKNDERYLPMFRDHRVVGAWLPPTMYVTRFETNAFRPLATFEEDIDVTSGTQDGVVLRGDSLSTWREATLELRSSNRNNTSASQENQAVWLGWNNHVAGPDTTRMGPPATFTVTLPPGMGASWSLDARTTLDFMLAPTRDVPGPRPDPHLEGASSRSPSGAGRRGQDDDRGETEPPPVDLSVEVEDAAGRRARLPVSRYGALRRPLETWVMRRRDQERERFQTHWELILQTYSIPLGDFLAQDTGLDLSRLTAVRFVFDRAAAGEVAVDQIGFSALDPGFLSARVERPGGEG